MWCRICRGAIRTVLDLGRQPSANRFVLAEETADEYFFNLVLGRCERCTMVQLMQHVPQEIRYPDSYRYRASGSASHRAHFAGLARRLLRTELAGNGFLVEIGCNDGVLLETIARAGVAHLGIEPAGEVAAIAAAKDITVEPVFFDELVAANVRERFGPARVIIGANTICHIADQAGLFHGVRILLDPDGVFMFEEPYLATIVEKMAFDQIYDEHTFYFTVESVRAMAHQFGLELVDVQDVPLHGGEIRYTLAWPGRRPVSPAVARQLAAERSRGLSELSTLEKFATAVDCVRADLVGLIRDQWDQGRTVVGYGAPGKAATVTNYCGIGPDLIPCVYDSTPAKQGRLVPGSHIPVRASEEFARDRPDVAVLFAWNHAEEIMAREPAFQQRGGRWIRYVPDVHLD